MTSCPDWLKSLVKAEALPASFESLAINFYLPLTESIASWHKQAGGASLVVGVNGAQGTGKSTLSKVIAEALEHNHQLNCAIISIDDIYLTKQKRALLSETVHPLFKTRGVPGTHDVSLGIKLIQSLKNKQSTKIPIFEKAVDDRAPTNQWVSYDNPVDIIIFEGWCVGAIDQEPNALKSPCNALEKKEDKDATWRTFANEHLAGSYRGLFNLIDKLVMLKAPDFECVYHWRSTQEEKLRERTARLGLPSDSVMDDTQIKRFIMHYERITRWMFTEMPERADCLLELSHDHGIVRASYSER